MGDGGAMGGRMAGRPRQGDGVSPSSCYLLDFNERDILHTIGIHKEVGAPKKVRKKGAHLLCSEKGENGGLTFFSLFFQSWNKKAIPK